MVKGGKIKGIILENADGSYSLWTDFGLSDEEEQTIMHVLSKHETEGGSETGKKKDITKSCRLNFGK